MAALLPYLTTISDVRSWREHRMNELLLNRVFMQRPSSDKRCKLCGKENFPVSINSRKNNIDPTYEGMWIHPDVCAACLKS